MMSTDRSHVQLLSKHVCQLATSVAASVVNCRTQQCLTYQTQRNADEQF
jgi:hypothetical protein